MENKLFEWILQNILENQTFQRIGKFIMADFYEMDFAEMDFERFCYLVKGDEVYNILKSASHSLLVER